LKQLESLDLSNNSLAGEIHLEEMRNINLYEECT
jgi:hypothetical protein